MVYVTLRRSPLLLIPVAMLAACSAGGAATTGPATTVPATVAAATPAAATPATNPTEGVATTEPVSSTAPTPSAAAATVPPPVGDLADVVPTEVGGITLTPQSVPIDDFLGGYEEFQAVLDAVEKTPDDVEIIQAQGSSSQGGGEVMIVQAFRVAGADAAALMDSFLEFWKVSEDVASPITIGGKELIVQGHPDTDAQYKSYYYGYGDVVFRLGYNGDNFDEQMAALASQLP